MVKLLIEFKEVNTMEVDQHISLKGDPVLLCLAVVEAIRKEPKLKTILQKALEFSENRTVVENLEVLIGLELARIRREGKKESN